MRRARILAVDYGTKNIGLAYSDELGVTVRPLPSLPNLGTRRLLSCLKTTIDDRRIERLVIGIPYHMNGTAGDGVRRSKALIEMLQSELSLPVCGFDERLSTVEASELWNAMSERQRKRYRTVDSLAAAIILQRFLEEG